MNEESQKGVCLQNFCIRNPHLLFLCKHYRGGKSVRPHYKDRIEKKDLERCLKGKMSLIFSWLWISILFLSGFGNSEPVYTAHCSVEQRCQNRYQQPVWVPVVIKLCWHDTNTAMGIFSDQCRVEAEDFALVHACMHKDNPSHSSASDMISLISGKHYI